MTSLEEVSLKDIEHDPEQPRKALDQNALTELSKSIKKHGIIQPILLRRSEEGKHIIVAGERRYRATEMAGKKTIPAIFTEGKPSKEYSVTS